MIGLAAVHAWSGGPFDKYIYPAEANAHRTIRMTMLIEGDGTQVSAASEFEKFAGAESTLGGHSKQNAKPETPSEVPAEGQWYSQSRRVRADPFQVGISGNQITVTRLTAESVRFFAKPWGTCCFISSRATPWA